MYSAARALGPGRLGPAALLALGALLVESAITRVCPLNHLLGLDTRGLGLKSTPPVRPGHEIDARPPTLMHTDFGAEAADLDLPYDDFASFQRPPADS